MAGRRFIGGIATLAGVSLLAVMRRAYQQQIITSIAQQAAGSQITETPRGPVEYAFAGPSDNGKIPVLIAHSSGGGYDQSLATGRRFHGHPVIAPSRAGYLRTPLAVGQTPAAMADGYASLLDSLDISQVIMVGFSAGGMSALEFALRHADRCRALVLGGAVTQPPPAYVLNVLAPIATANRSDFLNWLLSTSVHSAFLPLTVRDRETREILQAFQQTNPASHRAPGYRLDIAQMREFTPSLENITAPTLLLHGDMDFLIPLSHARRAAERIPNARLVVVKGGSHDAPIRYPALVVPVIQHFLNQFA